ncbi:MAG: T9SS type A sorting domain-containing protein [Rhodothermaceae bacterium]|nr:T9SS type A sorting domain-containing protein [Rhodothermaceae bacterium]
MNIFSRPGSARQYMHWAVSVLIVCFVVQTHAYAQDLGGIDSGLEAETPLKRNCPMGVEPVTDFDADCVDDTLERNGFDRNLEACTPGPEAPGCFVTDPTAWSTDGDPYSDFQEATGVNMDNTIVPPYNGPLVAAAPLIEVVLLSYRFTPRATITDSQGQEISQSSTQEWNVSATVGVSYTSGVEVGLTSASASAETTVSASVTAGYSSSQTMGQSLNWESATTTESDNAATLSLDIAARNVGSATALNVRPTFNLFVGNDPIGTITPSQEFPSNLTPDGMLSDFITVDTRQVGDSDVEITLSIDQLRRIQSGAPIKIQVIGLEAGISRWRPEDSNWSCPDPCQWEEFQDQIEARTLRLLVDFGYSGEREENIPREFTGNPFEYRIFTGSPNSSAGHTLEDLLRFANFELGESSGETTIEGRAYPSTWYITSGPEQGGITRDSTFLDYWNAAGSPDDILNMVMPRGASVLMASPDPVDPAPFITTDLVSSTMRNVFIGTTPKGSIPIAGGEARVVYGDGREETIPLEQIGNSGFYQFAQQSPYPIGLASSEIVIEDVLGNERVIERGLIPPVPVTQDCNGIDPRAYREPRFEDTAEGTRDGVSTVFIDLDLDKPATAYCVDDGSVIDFWYPQVNDMELADINGVAIIDRDRRVAVGENAILYSPNAGQSWTRVTLAQENQTMFRAVSLREGTETLVAVGDEGIFMRSVDGGLTWERTVVETPAGPFLDVDYAGGDTWYAVGSGRVRKSIDDGLTWSPAAVNTVDEAGNPVSRPGFANLTAVEFISETEGVIGDFLMDDDRGRVYATQDGGETWRHTDSFLRLNDIEYAGNGNWFIVGRDKIVIAEDIFSNSDRRIVLDAPDTRIVQAVSFATPEIGFAVTESGPVYRTADGGETWAAPFGGYPTPTHPGSNFMRDIDMLDANIGAVVGTDGVIGASDSGGGQPVLSSDSTSTSIEVEIFHVPTHIELGQNYPNPFSGSTTITYQLDENQDIRLDVFDLLGRRLKTLENGLVQAGNHQVVFDATGLPSGIYMYRLTTGENSSIRQMVVLR